ncbi:agmatinase [Rubrimonas cliftonensis]|uniref:Agmatinase n=1 Tax=Rubrimonas cliftonensis TaxID=89524 RepID=A0A1H3WNW7_9RHOB|nr:agmatinase [Rubrimonas cliftonensis]SDZ88877.1 agmatinase [Rubrimonas cliftonensis]
MSTPPESPQQAALRRRDNAFAVDDPHAVTHDEYMYAGALSFCRRRYARTLEGVDLAVVGVPFDTAVTNRPGCRLGPRAIRAASTNLAWSRAWPSPFDPFERLSVADWGDVWFDHGRPETVPAQIEAALASVLEQGAGVLALGGDHFTTWPSLKAHVAKHGGPLALVQFDAHTDTWPDDGRIDHGTMFYHAIREGLIDPAASIQVGIRTTNDDPMGVQVFDALMVHEQGWRAAAEAIRARVGNRPVYVTVDIDALDPSQAPGTGTPVCGGLFMHQLSQMIRAMQGLDVLGMDVVEVSPPYDNAEITALAGATVALELACLYASGARFAARRP